MYRVYLTVCGCWLALTSLAMAQKTSPIDPPLGNVITPTEVENPRNARELAAMRAYYDKTVWADEVIAQDYEQTFVALWDKFIHEPDRFRVLMDAPFNQLVIKTSLAPMSLPWGIELSSQEGETRTIPFHDWPALVTEYQKQGYKILDTEWHHSTFDPPRDGPARSTMAMVLQVVHEPTNTRYLLKGDLLITWKVPEPGAKPPYSPDTIDATKITVMKRQGDLAFTEQTNFSYNLGDGTIQPTTIHPVILQDLNGDHRPEVIMAGVNEIHWNRGDWKFEKADLVSLPTKNVNAGLFGDFDGDGHLDFMCAPKNGFPQLYRGGPNGEFKQPPQKVAIGDQMMRIPVGMTAGDIDGDGDLDVFISQNKTGYQTGEIPTPYYDANDGFPSYLLLNDGHGNFRDVTSTSGLYPKRNRRNFSASFVDLNGDLKLDLLLTNDFCGTDLFINEGNATFTDITEKIQPRPYGHGMSHSFGDYDLDGRLDFFMVAMSSTTARRLDQMQLGRPQFDEYNKARGKMGYGNRLILNRPEGFIQASFNDTVARTGWSWGSTTLDFDRDADPDLYVANGQTSGKTTADYCTRYWCHDLYYKSGKRPDPAIREFFQGLAPLFDGNSISWNGYEHNALLMNLDGQKFVNVGFVMGCDSVLDSRAVVGGDIDLDGRVDLIYEHVGHAQRNTTVHLLRNQFTDSNHWIGLHLTPGPASPHLYGTQVEVELANGRKLVQHYVSGHSVWASHPTTIHFGMGSEQQVKGVNVTWPNGKKTRLENPGCDQYHVVSPVE